MKSQIIYSKAKSVENEKKLKFTAIHALYHTGTGGS